MPWGVGVAGKHGAKVDVGSAALSIKGAHGQVIRSGIDTRLARKAPAAAAGSLNIVAAGLMEWREVRNPHVVAGAGVVRCRRQFSPEHNYSIARAVHGKALLGLRGAARSADECYFGRVGKVAHLVQLDGVGCALCAGVKADQEEERHNESSG